MGGIDLLLPVVFALMGLAVILDRTSAARQRPAQEAVPTAATTAEAEVLRFPELGAHAEGWALLAPTGAVVATNVPERAPLLVAACAILRLAGDSGPGGVTPLPWRTVTLEGEHGLLLGEMSPRGAVLAVLARGKTDHAALRAAMAEALAEVERRWDEVVPPHAMPPPSTDLPPGDPSAEGRFPTAFTPLD